MIYPTVKNTSKRGLGDENCGDVKTVLSVDFNNIIEKLKQGDALTPLFFNFASEYAIGRVQVKRNGLKLNGTHQLLVYGDDVNKTENL